MIKNRSESLKTSRTYDKDGFVLRAGCLCFRDEDEQEVLLVSSLRKPDKWVVPAGGIENGEEPHETATREVQEEAGVMGKLGRFLGIFQNDLSRTKTWVFVLVVTDELETWEESRKGRKRSWFPIDTARDLLSAKPVQQRYLVKAKSTR
ncbi:diphosphoinositol polyphosphate phosphohydrolase 2 [Exaiptasia diaphana]|uniref:diphosphoinositol-polyphosphate diphosphatase n=1 Tax=Exaiptasia diaphana TaxID=2652724 RepID=A0A913XQI4_EXADI|nr:diphosphoinositol polyphosphate phosphohydrolase 2 [Exaiptasia diaphana]KXJ09730.1 Diphosphoinositol polyphosphate phosphohydrolase 1 [Exaiptasia diaphana]